VCGLYSLEFGCDFILLPWVAVWMVLECCKAEVSRLIKSENTGRYNGCLSQVKGSDRRTSDGTEAVHRPCTILWPKAKRSDGSTPGGPRRRKQRDPTDRHRTGKKQRTVHEQTERDQTDHIPSFLNCFLISTTSAEGASSRSP
jgi:hypothetical protein